MPYRPMNAKLDSENLAIVRKDLNASVFVIIVDVVSWKRCCVLLHFCIRFLFTLCITKRSNVVALTTVFLGFHQLINGARVFHSPELKL